MTGFRSAALFALREPPEGAENPDAWLAEYDRVLAFREQGLDPGGHMPPMPHLCAQDATKVCNCCPTCACVPEEKKSGLPDLFATLPRIAYALESLVLLREGGTHHRYACNTCGCSTCTEADLCPVCGGT